MQRSVNRLVVHSFKAVGQGLRVGITAADSELVDVIDCDRRLLAEKNARQRWPECNGAERRFLCVLLFQACHRAIQPAVLRALHSRCARFHLVLRLELRTSGVGRAGGWNNAEMLLLPKRLECAEQRWRSKKP